MHARAYVLYVCSWSRNVSVNLSRFTSNIMGLITEILRIHVENIDIDAMIHCERSAAF